MRKVNSVIGQDLISLADGHRIASVKDVVIGEDHSNVAGLVVSDAGLMTAARVVDLAAVHSYGRDAIVITGDDAVVDSGTRPDIPAEGARSLAGMKVFSDAGDQLGSIADLYFEEDDGRIVGFEITSGAVDDFATGRRFLPVEDLDHIGDEIVYVRAGSASELGPVPGSSGGVTGMVEDARAKATEAIDQGAERLSEAGAKIGEAGSKLSVPPSAEDREAERQRAHMDLVGRRSGADVTDPDGRIIVANGQLISAEHVERAKAAGETESLRAAADAWSAAERERIIGGTIEQVADAAGSAWDRFMRKISELTDESGKRMSEQQTKARLDAINDAVGRPVTKVILDRSDEVILNLGDIITHEAIQRSYEAGNLDTLLRSVYEGEVSFERDEMKAATEGTSTVERASGGAALVEELQASVDTADAERQAQSEQQRREASEARDRRDTEREERARAREEAARRAEAGEPLEQEPAAVGPDPSRKTG